MLLLEVMDKVPSAARIVTVGVAVGVVGYALVRRWRWPVVPVLIVAAVLAWARFQIYDDPFVGPAVWAESRLPHALAVGFSALCAVGAPLIALWLRKRAS